jgi:hypothetical protein
MSPTCARRPGVFVFIVLLVAGLLAAPAARAGDPIPEIDVVLEQIPGGFTFGFPAGGLDELVVESHQTFAQALTPIRLPAGWTLETQGKTTRLSGPALPAGEPVRLELDAGTAPRPPRISYQVKLAGRTLLQRKNVGVEPVPPRRVIGSLQGVVTAPSRVAPGEPMLLRVTDATALPPGGTWRISGVVVDEPESEEEEAPVRRLALVVQPGEEGVDEAALADVATVLAARRAEAGSWQVGPLHDDDAALEGAEVWAVARTAAGGSAGSILAARHETAKSAIRNLKAMAAPSGGRGGGELPGKRALTVRPVDGAGSLVVVIGVELPLAAAPNGDDEEGDDCEGGVWWDGFCFERLPHDCYEVELMEAEDPPLCIREESAELTVRGDGATVYEIDVAPPATRGEIARTIVNTTRSHLKTRPAATSRAAADGTVAFYLPEDLRPGESLSLQYVDLYGDVVLDVPEVEGVEVVEPAAEGAGARIEAATPLAGAGQQACVCGLFPGPAAWSGLLLDGEPLGEPLSASSRMAWFRLPPTLAPGPHVVSGAPEPGFPPADQATIEVVAISGEVDSRKLQRLESTPLRLWVDGTSRPVELRLRNETPGIVRLEGGDDQTARTTGGSPNQVERTVSGLSPGAFDVQFELLGTECPCASADVHYW